MRFSHNTRVKRLFARLLFSVSLIAATCLSSLAQDWRTVHDGMEYAEVTRIVENQPVRMNLLRLDLKKVRLDVVHAMDAAIGTETVSSMASRHGAVAAINAGFFRLDNSKWAGDPAGVLMIDNQLLSESSKGRVALGITNLRKKTTVTIANLNIGVGIQSGRELLTTIAKINCERKPGDIVVYTPEFGLSTLTDILGTEIIVSNSLNSKTVINYEIKTGVGNSQIPRNGFVLSLSGSVGAEVAAAIASRRRPIRFGPTYVPTIKKDTGFPTEDITNGVPRLIKNGRIDITWQEEKTTKSFVETRHPRTAVAKLKDGKFLMVTVDGRSESSGGISLNDLAAYLLELGATDAMNLDGGGSTTMFLDGKVVNHPSDKEGERKVSDAILVTIRKK